jgi:hypothetical protein
MARGWESKAVEEQIEEAARDRISAATDSPVNESFERKQKRQGLLLTRSSLVQQLSRARTVAHRQMIHQALRDIDEQLGKFEI